MKNSPLVSVLMTAYNREKYIAEAIQSVLESTYSNWELIIVDDCSVDNTVVIAKEFEKIDDRIRVYVNENNLGDYPNRNKAAGYARGKYLKYLDSDDMIYGYGLEAMVDAIEQFPDAGMVMMWPYDHSVFDPIILSPEMALRQYFIFNKWLMVGPSGCLYSAKIFFELGGFSGKNYVGDFEFNMKSILKYPIIKIPNGLLYYRIHDQQQGNESGHKKSYRVLLYKIQKDTISNILCPLSQADKMEAIKKIERLQARRVVFYFVKTLNLKEAIRMVTESDMGWKRFIKGLFSFDKFKP